MKKRLINKSAYRPRLDDVLEDRIVLSAVPSAAVATTAAAFQGVDLTQARGQIDAAFGSFASSYAQAEATYSANPNPAALSSLQGAATTGINALIQQIDGIVAALPGASTTLAGYITGPLAGSGYGTLQQQLSSIQPVGTAGQTSAVYAQQASTIIANAQKVTDSAFTAFGNLVNLNLYSQSQSTSTAAGATTRAQQYKQYYQNLVNQGISNAFNTYLNSIVSYRNSILFKTGSTGSSSAASGASAPIDLTANAAQYNQVVANATISLGYSLTTILLGDPGAVRSLAPSIIQSLYTPGTGLVSQLQSLPLPTDLSGLSSQGYNIQTFNLINTAYEDVLGRVASFNQSSQFNFTPYNQFGNNPFVPYLDSNGVFTGQVGYPSSTAGTAGSTNAGGAGTTGAGSGGATNGTTGTGTTAGTGTATGTGGSTNGGGNGVSGLGSGAVLSGTSGANGGQVSLGTGGFTNGNYNPGAVTGTIGNGTGLGTTNSTGLGTTGLGTTGTGLIGTGSGTTTGSGTGTTGLSSSGGTPSLGTGTTGIGSTGLGTGVGSVGSGLVSSGGQGFGTGASSIFGAGGYNNLNTLGGFGTNGFGTFLGPAGSGTTSPGAFGVGFGGTGFGTTGGFGGTSTGAGFGYAGQGTTLAGGSSFGVSTGNTGNTGAVGGSSL